MAMSLTDSLKHNRYSVVSVDKAAGRLRIKSEADICSDFGCGEAVVVTDEGRTVVGLLTRAGILRLIEARMRLGV